MVKRQKKKTKKTEIVPLAEAFSGELVETGAEIARREGREYETAEVLIERIKKGKMLGKKENDRSSQEFHIIII